MPNLIKLYKRVAAIVALAVLASTYAAPAQTARAGSTLANDLRNDLSQYLADRKVAEHISALSLSINFGDGTWIDVATGTTGYDGKGNPVTPSHLFQIGSNTKAFTAVAAIHLQRAGKLSLDDSVAKWLPQYSEWKSATIRQMLDMTSGIETYDGTQRWQRAYAANPKAFETDAKLVSYVYPEKQMPHGWSYSNTGYILTSMIIAKASGMTYDEFLHQSVIKPTGIANLYYYPGIYPVDLRTRTVSGYFFSHDADNAGLAPLLGASMRDESLSWAQAAGAVVATPHAVVQWARDLYQGDIVTAAERAEMFTFVSSKTGNPIAAVSEAEPMGFGLGVTHVWKPGLGTFAFYEGETLGYRMVHCYFPKQNMVLAVGLNSQPDHAKDNVGELVRMLVKTLQAHGKF